MNKRIIPTAAMFGGWKIISAAPPAPARAAKKK